MLDKLVVGQAKFMKVNCRRSYTLSKPCEGCEDFKFCTKYYPDTRLMDVPLNKLTYYVYNEVKNDLIQLLNNVYLGGK